MRPNDKIFRTVLRHILQSPRNVILNFLFERREGGKIRIVLFFDETKRGGGEKWINGFKRLTFTLFQKTISS